MTNQSALRELCHAIASSFCPDDSTVRFVLFNNGIDADGDAVAKDEALFRLAVSLVMGYVESSRSENGVSVSVMEDAVKESLRRWCRDYGLELDDLLEDSIRVIEDGSSLW